MRYTFSAHVFSSPEGGPGVWEQIPIRDIEATRVILANGWWFDRWTGGYMGADPIESNPWLDPCALEASRRRDAEFREIKKYWGPGPSKGRS